ncbi:MAG TPA: hypothetical protein VMT87_17040 [Vicinamibacteria bacterium]|nr:hypothetical protein [Vicinamibacteria bacterium]
MTEEPGATASETSVAGGVALAFAAALGATLLMAAPVVLAPGERLFGSGEILGREDPNRDPFVVIEQFRTGHVPGPYLQPLTDLPGRALAGLVGPVAAYNVLVLATFPLAASAAYLLARHVVGSHLGAMVAGLAYAFLPFHVTQAAGHPHAAQTQWLPLYLLALWRCVDRPNLPRAALLLASAASVTLSNFYGGLIAAVLSPVALAAYGLGGPNRPGDGRLRRVAITGLVLAAAAAAGLVLVHLFAPAVLLRPGSVAFARADLFTWSAKWWSYLVPPVEHPLLGSTVREFWARRGVGESLLEHQQVGVGFSLLALGAVPLWRWLRGDRDSLAVRSAPVLASLAGAALLCSLSPERRIGPLTFVRPSALLYEVAPMFRAYARFGAIVGLMVALAAGAGAVLLWRRPGSAGRRAAALLLGLAVLEFAPFPPWRWRDVLPTRAHRWLAAQPGSLRVLDCVPPSRVSDALVPSLLRHRVSLLGAPLFDDCGEPRLADRLGAMGYTHVVVRRDSAMGRWLAANPEPEGFARGPEFEDGSILEVKGKRSHVYVSALFGFYPREYERGTTWRWTGQTGELRVVATRASAGTVLHVELKAFPGHRRVEWLLDGRPLGEVEAAADWRWYELPLGPLTPGETTLTFACREPAKVADDVLHNGDARPLGLAVGAWRFEDEPRQVAEARQVVEEHRGRLAAALQAGLEIRVRLREGAQLQRGPPEAEAAEPRVGELLRLLEEAQRLLRAAPQKLRLALHDPHTRRATAANSRAYRPTSSSKSLCGTGRPPTRAAGRAVQHAGYSVKRRSTPLTRSR